MIGGQVGIIGHIEIADEVKIAAQSGIGHSISEKGAIIQGSPAIPLRILNVLMSYSVICQKFKIKLMSLKTCYLL